MAAGVAPDRLVCSSSTPMQHLPFSLEAEPAGSMAAELHARLSFAVQKLGELKGAAEAAASRLPLQIVVEQHGLLAAATAGASMAPSAGQQQQGVHLPLPAEAEVDKAELVRSEPYSVRRPKQIHTPAFPTTTIGSFPQTQGEGKKSH